VYCALIYLGFLLYFKDELLNVFVIVQMFCKRKAKIMKI